MLGRSPKAIGRHPFASGGTGSAIDETAPFLRPKNIQEFISSDLERSAKPILYLPRNPTAGASGVGYGYRGRLLPDVCWVYQDAMLAGKLLASQQHIGEACRAFLKALTNFAIDDLIDRATGFDDIRKRAAIDKIIERYCAPKALAWVRVFDVDFYRQVYRLNGWPKISPPVCRRYWPLLSILALIAGLALLSPCQTQYYSPDGQAEQETAQQLPWSRVLEIITAGATALLALFAFVQVSDSRRSDEQLTRWCYWVRPERHRGDRLRAQFIQWGGYNESGEGEYPSEDGLSDPEISPLA